MNPDIRLTDNEPRILQKLLLELAQEEVILKHALLDDPQPLLRALEVEFSIQISEEPRDRVLVLVRFSLEDFHYGL